MDPERKYLFSWEKAPDCVILSERPQIEVGEHTDKETKDYG